MKKSLKLLTSALLFGVLLTSCSGGGSDSSTKTTIRFYYHNGALRDEWVNNVKKDFEEMYKNVSFESGKTGVEVLVKSIKGDPSVESISSNTNDVFWVESLDYYTLSNYGGPADITDVIQSPAIRGVDKDGKDILEDVTIESKLREANKTYYNLGTAAAPKYKALPAFESSFFLNYNVDLFDQKGFYFAKGKTAENASFDLDVYSYELANLFVLNSTDEKSAGPDGVLGTSDDGLPATFADFRALLTYIKENSVLPLIWNGLDTGMGYLTSFLLTVWGNTSGADKLALSNTFNGTSGGNVVLNNGQIVKEGGKVKIDNAPLSISGSNAYRLHEQKGCYDALSLAKIIMRDSNNYYKDGFSTAFTHRNCQKKFVDENSGTPIAMMIEANWWNSEATDDYISSESKMSRKFGIMPVPHADASLIGGRNVMISDRQSSLFIRSTCKDAKLAVSKKFVSYLNSDVCMNTFSKYTDMMRNMEYKLTQDTLDAMTPYGRNLYEFSSDQKTDHLDWLPQSPETRKNISLMAYADWGFKSDPSLSSCPFKRFRNDDNLTVDELFEDINEFYSTNWSTLYTAPKN